MKRILFLFSCLLGAFLMAPASASAQPGVEDAAVVRVPFDFVAGDQKLPAGSYRVEVLPRTEDEEPALVTLEKAARGEKPEGKVFQSLSTEIFDVEVDDETELEEAKLVFRQVGELYFLDEVELP